MEEGWTAFRLRRTHAHCYGCVMLNRAKSAPGPNDWLWGACQQRLPERCLKAVVLKLGVRTHFVSPDMHIGSQETADIT